MTDYIKQLEQQNEELKQKLADVQLYKPVWIKDNVAGFKRHRYLLGNRLYGIIMIDTSTHHVVAQTMKNHIGKNVTLEEAKECIEHEFEMSFLRVELT